MILKNISAPLKLFNCKMIFQPRLLFWCWKKIWNPNLRSDALTSPSNISCTNHHWKWIKNDVKKLSKEAFQCPQPLERGSQRDNCFVLIVHLLIETITTIIDTKLRKANLGKLFALIIVVGGMAACFVRQRKFFNMKTE